MASVKYERSCVSDSSAARTSCAFCCLARSRTCRTRESAASKTNSSSENAYSIAREVRAVLGDTFAPVPLPALSGSVVGAWRRA